MTKSYSSRIGAMRLIARLDIKSDKLIKTIKLEGVQHIGDPGIVAKKYYEQGIDEILLLDTVASLYGRNHLVDVIKYVSSNTYIPITVGGGIRSIEDVESILSVGGDKIAINTAVIKNPVLISDLAKNFGSQCIVLQVDAKFICEGKWEPYTDGGRERTYLDVIDWVKKGYEMGAGEILLTSIDREGTCKGLDLGLCNVVSKSVPIPVIASGGVGSIEDVIQGSKNSNVDAIAMSDLLNVKKINIKEIKDRCAEKGIEIRKVANENSYNRL